MADKKDVLIKVNGLKTYYPVKQGVFKRTVGYVKAVDDVNLDIYKGEILGVVGESGCGKTTLGKSILQLIKPTEGSIRYSFETGERELIGMNKRELDEARCKMQIVFQDPYSSLNPSFTIFGSMQEPLIRSFHPRCPECMEKCRTEIPHPTIIMQEGREHMVCCHRVSEQAAAKKEVQTTGGNHE